MRSLPALLLLLPLVACDSTDYGDNTITGALGSVTFDSKDITVYHGTRHIVVVDRKIDCIDMSWVTRNYFVEDITSEAEFAAIQFTFDEDGDEDDDDVAVGNFDLIPGEGAVSSYRLLNLDLPEGPPPPLDFDRSREGILEVPAVSDTEVSGEFDVIFGDGNAGGTFRSAHCRNVR